MGFRKMSSVNYSTPCFPIFVLQPLKKLLLLQVGLGIQDCNQGLYKHLKGVSDLVKWFYRGPQAYIYIYVSIILELKYFFQTDLQIV